VTWVKICGITNVEDALTAVDAGADALGFVFYEKSPRCVTQEVVRDIVRQLPLNIEKVGVFVEESPENIRGITQQASLTAVQLYTEGEKPERIRDLIALEDQPGAPKLIIAKSATTLRGVREGFYSVGDRRDIEAIYALLLDSGSGTLPGGTGNRFDWVEARWWVRGMKPLVPVIVAGGLEPSNVAVAMGICQPWGVDVSSGVEASPGKKDPDKIRAFIAAVRDADKKEQEIP
jgi:phosphoribosylanthranilate isomerase